MQQCDYHLFLQAMKGINALFTSFFEVNNKHIYFYRTQNGISPDCCNFATQ